MYAKSDPTDFNRCVMELESPFIAISDDYIMENYYVPLTFNRIGSKSLIVLKMKNIKYFLHIQNIKYFSYINHQCSNKEEFFFSFQKQSEMRN